MNVSDMAIYSIQNLNLVRRAPTPLLNNELTLDCLAYLVTIDFKNLCGQLIALVLDYQTQI
jgi:hypothetical protein